MEREILVELMTARNLIFVATTEPGCLALVNDDQKHENPVLLRFSPATGTWIEGNFFTRDALNADIRYRQMIARYWRQIWNGGKK